MSIKVVECGPFGRRLDRGKVNSLDEIHEDFMVVSAEAGDDLTVFVEPSRQPSIHNNVK